MPPPAAVWREGAAGTNGRTEVEGKFAVPRLRERRERRESSFFLLRAIGIHAVVSAVSIVIFFFIERHK